MFERLTKLFKRVRGEEVAQLQREALVDVLIRTMYADGHLALPENERLEQLEEELPWESVTPVTTYVNAAIARVRGAVEDADEDRALLASVADRLGTAEMRRSAYDACDDLARSDGEVSEAETRFLDRLRAVLLEAE